MCGIFFYQGAVYNLNQLEPWFNRIKHRGPDDHRLTSIDKNVTLGFHRLSINGLDSISGQPMHSNGVYLICNGEIYNYKALALKYKITLDTHSDCEIILKLYHMFGIEETCKLISGEFAFVIYDSRTDATYIARDPIGIRSLYWSTTAEGTFIASEMKAIPTEINHVTQFPAGSFFSQDGLKSYYEFNYNIDYSLTSDMIETNINKILTECVQERLMSDRPIGCILSGGLDSTLVTAIVARTIGGSNLNTYTIGLKGGTDLYFARLASQYLGTKHHEFIVSEKEFLDAIEETIYQIESWDTTTVRASVGNYLVSKKIQELGQDVVIFCGDVSDEVFGSYRGFQMAPDDSSFKEQNDSQIRNIRFFDLLRSDKSISGASLEARVPYGDKKFVDFVMSIPPSFKRFDSVTIEKLVLRKAFEGFLPEKLLYRSKSAFSDAVSSVDRSWFEIIKEYVETKISDDYFESAKNKYNYQKPYDKESLYYREIFEKYYPNRAQTIPYFWRQPFSTNLDPSARLLECHVEQVK